MSCISLSIVRHCVESSSSFIDRSVLLESSSFWRRLLAMILLCLMQMGGADREEAKACDTAVGQKTYKGQELSPVSFDCVPIERYDFVDYKCIQEKRILGQGRQTLDGVRYAFL